MQQRWLWNADRLGVTLALTPHDATSAYLSMNDVGAREAGADLAIKECLVPHAVVWVAAEEAEVDILLGAGI